MKKNIVKIVLLITIILLIIVLINIIKEEINQKKEELLETKSINQIINNINGQPNEVSTNSTYELTNNENIVNKSKENEKTTEGLIEYELVLEIPKISLKKGILNKNNPDNNVDKNITILKESSYPNETGTIYLAAHSGNGKQSYFNDLKELVISDEAILYYQNQKYIYYVKEIKEVNKNSQLSLLTQKEKSLILITCSQTNKNKYLIIILTQ